jgi:hypothetical protein
MLRENNVARYAAVLLLTLCVTSSAVASAVVPSRGTLGDCGIDNRTHKTTSLQLLSNGSLQEALSGLVYHRVSAITFSANPTRC